MSAPDDDSTILAHGTVGTPQEPDDDFPIPDNSPTIQLFAPAPTGLLPDPAATPPSQPNVSTNAFTAATKIFSGNKISRRKKKRKKAREHAKLFAAKPLIEPFIAANTTQNEPAPPLITEAPVSLDENDRLVVEPLYPGPSPVPMPVIRESIHPAIFGLAAIILIVFLGGLWWWNSKEAEPFPEDIDAPTTTLSSEPLPDAEPSLAISTPAPPAENTSTSSPEEQILEQEPESEPGSEQGLMNIPSLPANQQQGRHNQYNPTEIKDEDPLSVSPYPLPMPAPPVPAPPPARKQTIAAPPEPAEIPEPFEPFEPFEPSETPAHDETPSMPAPPPVTARPAAPPWLGRMRNDLSNCQSFFCREKVRRQYCTGQWETLPECRRASL